jgi:hypothetical protein
LLDNLRHTFFAHERPTVLAGGALAGGALVGGVAGAALAGGVVPNRVVPGGPADLGSFDS